MKTYKFGSWNVNGLRACMGKGFMDFFHRENFDILGLQEIKMMKEQATFEFSPHIEYWNSAQKKGYSGTALITREKPLKVTYGLGVDIHDQEGRLLTAEYEHFYYVTVYTPNAKRDLSRLAYRMEWEDAFCEYLVGLKAHKGVIVCGDLNVAHSSIDLKNPKANEKNAGYTIQERTKFSQLLNNGFVDTFRYFYPTQEEAYTWWSYMAGARAKNIGWRIDYFLVSQCLIPHLTQATIYPEVYGSDHCPIGLSITI